MKKTETKKNKADLEKELAEKILAVRDIRFGMAGSKSKNVKEQRNLRKEVARIKTALNGLD